MARVAWRNLTLWKQIGVFIRDTRKWRNLSHEQLASEANIDVRLLKRMERGKTELVTLEDIFRIKSVLNVSIEELIPHVS